jgi:cytochrome P450
VRPVSAAVPDVDLSDDESFRSGFPHGLFAVLRREHPVWWHAPTARTPDGEGFWVVSRYADVLDVLRDPDTFSSDRGGIRREGGTAIKDERSAGVMLNQTDDPQHHRLRSLVNRGFTPRAIARLELELARRAGELLEAAGDEFDVVASFARELPAQAICGVLGVPEADRPALLDQLDQGIEDDSPSILSERATAYIRDYARALVAAKRARPDGGIMSSIVHARLEDGSGLSDRELVHFFALLFPAGAETTRSAIAGAVLAFMEHPDQFDLVRRQPPVIPTAVEEVIRWTTPSVYKRRTASRATVLAGTAIAPGDKVTIWEMSANRDERAFDDPFRFDVTRHPNPHLGLGWGVHYCLGASLARLELRIALEALAERFTGFEPAGEPRWTPNNRLFGLQRLPVRALR